MNGSLAGNCHNTHPAVGLHFLEFHPNENKKIVSAGDRLARVTNKKGKKNEPIAPFFNISLEARFTRQRHLPVDRAMIYLVKECPGVAGM